MEELESLEARRKYSLKFTDEHGFNFNAIIEIDTNGVRRIPLLKVDGVEVEVHGLRKTPLAEIEKKVLDKFEKLLL